MMCLAWNDTCIAMNNRESKEPESPEDPGSEDPGESNHWPYSALLYIITEIDS